MKRIFSILFALMLLLSLGLVTAAPMAAQITVLDHFKCYRAWGMYTIGEPVYLEDQFGAVEAVVEMAEFFCNPVEKWDDGMVTPILNEDLHLTLYSLDHGEEPQERILKVENQFGTQQLVVSDPVLLGVPTWKEYPYPPVGLDHFLLYNVIEGPSVEVDLVLYDYNFEYYEDVWVLEPVYFANPVRKTDGGGVTEIENSEAHLVFYRIASNAYGSAELWVYNQFGEQYLEVYFDEYNPALLAVPSEKEPVQYTLTMAVAPAGTGTATDVTGASPYAEGATVSIEAVAATGYHFSHWTAAPAGSFANSNAASTTFTMPAQDVTVTANFEEAVQYSLTISSTAGGSVTTPGEGTFTYDAGTVVSLVATTATGYGFVNWAGDVDTIANVNAAETTITMEGDYEITARFMAGVVDAKTETVTNRTVDATTVADTEVWVTGTATVTVARYEDNPGGPPPTGFITMGKYIDVYVPDTTEVTEVEIRLYYTDAEVTAAGINEESLRLSWLDGGEWNECSHSDVNIDSNYIWAKIRATGTTPSLDVLQGSGWSDVGYKGPSDIDGPCFIATAAYDTDTAKEIDVLREFRDTVLLPNSLGAEFVSLYYKTSPPLANFISQHEVLRTVVRVGFLVPIVAILNWSHYLWSARG